MVFPLLEQFCIENIYSRGCRCPLLRACLKLRLRPHGERLLPYGRAVLQTCSHACHAAVQQYTGFI